MSEKKRVSQITRRTFLKIAGTAAGSLALPSSLLALDSTGEYSKHMTGDPVRIGFLVPRSNIYPSMVAKIINGMNLNFGNGDYGSGTCNIELVTEDIGFGQARAIQKSRKLIHEDRVDLVMGVMNAGVAAALHDVFHKGRTVLLITNVGECLVREGEHSPNIFYNSLNYWQASWAMGRWSQRNVGRTAVIATSLYDSGYDSLHAFRLGFESSGGKISSTFVTHGAPGTDDPYRLIEKIKRIRPDFVYAQYCGRQAVDFVKAYSDSGLAGMIPLAGSGFLVDEALLPLQGGTARGIQSCGSWAGNLDIRENRDFVKAYRIRHGHSPDAFAALGYETARLIADAMNAAEGKADRTGAFIETLRTAEVRGPRGFLRMNPQTHSVSAPLYIRQVRRQGNLFINAAISELEVISELDMRVEPIRTSLRTGWQNAYLCV